MTVRRTVSLPDDLDRAVLTAAGSNYSEFTQRALRNALVLHDLDLLAAYRAGATDVEDLDATVEADFSAEIAAQDDLRRRAS